MILGWTDGTQSTGGGFVWGAGGDAVVAEGVAVAPSDLPITGVAFPPRERPGPSRLVHGFLSATVVLVHDFQAVGAVEGEEEIIALLLAVLDD